MRTKRYTLEFKEEASRLVGMSGESVRSISKKLGVTRNTLYKWVKESKGEVIQGDKDLIEENKRLIKALKLAEEERDILKKAAAYFAKGSR